MRGAACRVVALLLQCSDHTQRANCCLQVTQTQVAMMLPPGSRPPIFPGHAFLPPPWVQLPCRESRVGVRISLPMLSPHGSLPPGHSCPRDTALLKPPIPVLCSRPWAPLPMLSLQMVTLNVPSTLAFSNQDGLGHCVDIACTQHLPQPLERPHTCRLGTRQMRPGGTTALER